LDEFDTSFIKFLDFENSKSRWV